MSFQETKIIFKIRDATADDMFQCVLIKNIAWVYAYKGIMSNAFLFRRTHEKAMKSTIAKSIESLNNTAGNKIFLVAENNDGEIVGFGFGGDVCQPMLSTDKELHALYVHPATHGQGAGKALLLEFAHRMQLQGAKSFCVGCLSDNKSLNFYKHLGGKIVFESNNPHFENLSETFLEYQIAALLADNSTS